MTTSRRFRPFALPRWNRDVTCSRDVCGRTQDRRVVDVTVIRTQTMDVWTAGSGQFVEQRLGVFQVGGVEAFGERAVEGGEQVARLAPAALLAPHPREVRCGAQFVPPRALLAG